MIRCEQDGCEWRGFLTDLAEHEYEVHGFGTWGGPDCERCEGLGFVPRRNGDDEPCPRCKGMGRT